MKDSTIDCGYQSDCFIRDNSSDALVGFTMEGINISAINSAYLYYISHAFKGSDSANIYCPDNGHRKNASCVIECDYKDTTCHHMNIFAREGLNDVIFKDSINATSTFANSILYCAFDTGAYCNLVYDHDGGSGDYICDNTTVDGISCQKYLIPTTMPTEYPTMFPTVTSGLRLTLNFARCMSFVLATFECLAVFCVTALNKQQRIFSTALFVLFCFSRL